MKFAGKVYTSNKEILLGNICANSFVALKRRASTLCNGYYSAVDTMVLHRVNDEEVNSLTFTRINRKSPDNRIIRGQWK